ncbi:MAG: sulfotransferase [Calditrichaeota bacterium]|nr:sulfotransferase [Calditrichota bacterium]HQU70719.1 sulfotransferase [Calditrichia bacterium]
MSLISPLKRVARSAIAAAHRASGVLDAPFYRNTRLPQWSPTFVLGAPRSGTTLLYQVLTSAFRFAYFPNVADQFYQCPIRMTRLTLPDQFHFTSTFESRYGREQGRLAPSEGGNVWNRWFPHENREGFNFTPANFLSEGDLGRIRTTIACFEDTFSAPFISKNVKMGVRLPALKALFPDANYCYIQRNPADVALSLLLYRRKSGKSWWSAMPREIEQLKSLSDLEQVVGQVYYLEQNIEEGLSDLPGERVLWVDYRDLCRNPRAFPAQLEEKFPLLRDFRVENSDGIPAAFKISHPRTEGYVSAAELAQLKQLVAARFPDSRIEDV